VKAVRSNILRNCNWISRWKAKIKCEELINFHAGKSFKDVINISVSHIPKYTHKCRLEARGNSSNGPENNATKDNDEYFHMFATSILILKLRNKIGVSSVSGKFYIVLCIHVRECWFRLHQTAWCLEGSVRVNISHWPNTTAGSRLSWWPNIRNLGII
jgi:hypothetical protein